MSMQLYINYGSVHLDLQDSGYKLIDGFFPETPDEGADSISDQFTILIQGSSPNDLKSKIGDITLMLEHARRHKDDTLAAWLFFSVDETITPNMSKITNGMVMYDQKLDQNWRRNKARLTIVIEHKPYWDSSVEVAVPLTNGNGTRVTNGITIYNHDDSGAGHDNWVLIDAADISGDMPGRTRLEVTNSYATSRLYTLWVGHNWTDPDAFIHILEGENAAGGSSLPDSGCSNGYYRQYSLPSGTEHEMFTWTLTDAYLNACKGQYYKILARFQAGAPTQVKFRLKLQFIYTDIWQSGQITLDTTRATQIRDLFTLRLPPWLIGETDLNELEMILTGQQNTGNPINVNLDFLQVTPLDSFRMLECSGYGILQNMRMVDDGVNESFYIDYGAGANKAGILVAYGNPIELYPAKKQCLYFLMHSYSANTAEILRTASIKLFYRPRRRTI